MPCPTRQETRLQCYSCEAGCVGENWGTAFGSTIAAQDIALTPSCEQLVVTKDMFEATSPSAVHRGEGAAPTANSSDHGLADSTGRMLDLANFKATLSCLSLKSIL